MNKATGAAMNNAIAGPGDNGEEPLPTRIKASWGFGAFGVAILMNAVGGLMVYYLTKIVGMPGWIAGALLSAARLFDAFNDPVIGYLSDRTPERFGGRRRPYLLTGSIACALAMLLCFNIPFSGGSALTVTYVAAVLGVGYVRPPMAEQTFVPDLYP